MAEIKNYPSNSIKSREKTAVKKEKPEITPVVENGDAKVMRPNIWRRIFNAFYPEATNKPLGQFFLFDLCIPTLRNVIGTIMISGGKNISNNYGGEILGSGKKSYENYYNGKVSYLNNQQKKPKIYDCEHVWYVSLAVAQGVIDQMNTVLQNYPVVSVADMKELSGLSNEIIPGDHHRGWSDIHDVKWYSDHGGYTVIYPPTSEL